MVATLLQKHELEQNREALLLQAKELQESVMQFRAQTDLMRQEHERAIAVARSSSYESQIVRWALGFHSISISLLPCHMHLRGDPLCIAYSIGDPDPDEFLDMLEINNVTVICIRISEQLAKTRRLVQNEKVEFVGNCSELPRAIVLLTSLAEDARKIVAAAHSDPFGLPLVTSRRHGIEKIISEISDCASSIRNSPAYRAALHELHQDKCT